MAIADNRERIYVTVSSEMASRIDFYREKMGLSRSAFCANLIGQGVMGLDKAMGLFDEVGNVIVSKSASLFDGSSDDGTLGSRHE